MLSRQCGQSKWAEGFTNPDGARTCDRNPSSSSQLESTPDLHSAKQPPGQSFPQGNNKGNLLCIELPLGQKFIVGDYIRPRDEMQAILRLDKSQETSGDKGKKSFLHFLSLVPWEFWIALK